MDTRPYVVIPFLPLEVSFTLQKFILHHDNMQFIAYIVLKQNVTQGVGERCGTIACPDSDGSVKLSELFTNNGHIATYFKGN